MGPGRLRFVDAVTVRERRKDASGVAALAWTPWILGAILEALGVDAPNGVWWRVITFVYATITLLALAFWLTWCWRDFRAARAAQADK